MSQLTDTQLTAQWTLIENETIPNANTAPRVGIAGKNFIL